MMDKKMKYGMKAYTSTGDFGYAEYRNNFYEVLQLYVQEARIAKHPQPTLWVYDGERYVRVHDFYFSELSPETYAKYLNERIIDGDELLATITD